MVLKHYHGHPRISNNRSDDFTIQTRALPSIFKNPRHCPPNLYTSAYTTNALGGDGVCIHLSLHKSYQMQLRNLTE